MAYTSTQLKTLTKTSGSGIKLINKVELSNTRVVTEANNVTAQVTGDIGAVFSVQVTRSSDGRYYNFATKTFEATITPRSRLKNQSPGSFTLAIPANGSGDTYTVIVMAEPHYNTRLSIGNGIRYAATITQLGNNSTITFQTDTSISTISATSMGTSSASSIDSYTENNAPTVSFVETKLTVPSAAGDYGVKITSPTIASEPKQGTWNANALYWVTTATDHETTSASTHDSGSTSTALVLNNVDDLYIGMHVSVIESGSVTSTMPTITAINTSTLTVTLSAAQTWASGKDITFRAYGANLISKAIGINLRFNTNTNNVRLGQISTTLRTAISEGQPTANVKGTTGISVGATVRAKFIDLATTTSTSSISATTLSTTVGDITVTNSEFTAGGYVGDVIYIDGYSNLIYLSGDISITKYPVDDQVIHIDISKFLTIGTTA